MFLLKKKKKPARPSGEEDKVVLRIRVRAYESKILDSSVKQIIDTAMRYDAEIVGPVPLPTEIKKYTVNRASFIYKNTREQFEIRVHKRLIDIGKIIGIPVLDHVIVGRDKYYSWREEN